MDDKKDFRAKPLEERTEKELLQSMLLLQRGSAKRIKTILIYIAVTFWLSVLGMFIYMLLMIGE